MRIPGFAGPTYTLRSVNADAQRTINLYPERNEMGMGKEQESFYLIGTPGLNKELTLAADDNGRALHRATNGTVYAVNGDKVYSIDSAFSSTLIGTINTTTGQVSMADDGTYLVIVDGIDGWYVTMSSGTLTQITDPDFLPASHVVWLDQFFVFLNTDTGNVFSAAANDPSSFDALDIAAAEGNPDNLISMITNNRQLWLLGEQSTEVYFFDSTSDSFPFTRIEGAFIEHGCAASFSVAKMQNQIYWLGTDSDGTGVVFRANGYQPERVSTHSIEYLISRVDDISTGKAYTYQEDGHFFYCLNFDNAETTFVFDSTTGLWHERAYLNDGEFERQRANNHTFAYGVHIVDDYANGNIYKLSNNYNTDDTQEIKRIRALPHLSGSLDYIFYHALQLDMEVGVGLDGGSSVQGHDPQAILQWSDDGGWTWSNEKFGDIGKIGARKKRVIWRRLGRSRDRVFRLTISDPNKIILLGAELDFTKGDS